MLSINRAGKHHSGFYPSSCPRNCSLLSSNKLDTYYSIHQSINLGGFFFLHLKKITITQPWPLKFLLDRKRSDIPCCRVNVCGSFNISANNVAKCWPILLHFRLGNLCSCCFIYIDPVLIKMAKSIHWLEHTLYFAFSTMTFSYWCCWPHQIGNMFSIYTELVFVALVGSLRCLVIFQKWAVKRLCLAISNTDNGNLCMPWVCAISISDWVFERIRIVFVWKWLYVCEIGLHWKHSLTSAELTAVGRGCSTSAVRAPL